MSKLLEGRTAIITGATRGIGHGIATSFAKQGCNLAFTYNSSVDAAKVLETELNSYILQFPILKLFFILIFVAFKRLRYNS